MTRLAVVALVAFISTAFLASRVNAGVPPSPTYGSASVDGLTGDWDVSGDFFAQMYRAGDPSKQWQSSLYLRYSCSEQRLYALVLVQPGYVAVSSPQDAWVKVDGVPGNLIEGSGSSFSWVGAGQGWEGSAPVAAGTYQITAHVNVIDESTETQTSRTSGSTARTSIPLVITCGTATPTATPTGTPTPPPPPPARIGDLIWEDLDVDGARDDGEPGIAGVTVTLMSGSTVVGTTTTDASGAYKFTVPAGTYTVIVSTPSGYEATTPGLGPVTVAAGAEDLSQDAGFHRPVKIGNFVFEDVDGDAAFDAGEPAIAGVTVTLMKNGSPVASTTTDASGRYEFKLPAGTYTVVVTAPAGFVLSTASLGPITLAPGAEDMNQDAGYYRPISIGDLIWRDSDADGVFDSVAGELPISGVTVTLRDRQGVVVGTRTTDAAGVYLFEGLRPGTYTVTVAPPAGHVPTYDLDGTVTPSVTGVTGRSGEHLRSADFGYRPAVAAGTGTPGYWKNHASAWPTTSIVIGGQRYTQAQALGILGQPESGDKTLTVFRGLVSAKLNVGIGNNSSCVEAAILAADAWLAQYPAGSGVKAGKGSPWSAVEAAYTTLDRYNNGLLPCAVHRS